MKARMGTGKPWRGRNGRLARLIALVALVAGLIVSAGPALAHREHHKHHPAPVVPAQPGPADAAVAVAPPAAQPAPSADRMEGMEGMEPDIDRSQLPFGTRLWQWLGRLHPFIVHFPIAFLPAALFTAVVGRRRPAFAAPVQFLVVAGGLLAPIAAVAGLLAGITADPEPILTYHRWLGIAIGVGGGALAVWAWKRPWEDRGAGMILALSLMTVAIAVQGFLGAAVTHGLEHLLF